MGVEVKGAGDGVVIADRGCNDGCCCDLKKGQQENQVSHREYCKRPGDCPP